MHMRGVRGEVAVAFGEGLGDEPVLGDGCFEPSRVVARQPAHSHEMRAHGAQGGGDVVVVDRSIHRPIEARDERVVAVAPRRGIEGCSGIRELGGKAREQLGVAACGGEAGGRLLQRAADLEERSDVVGVDVRHNRDPRRLLLDQAVGAELLQRFSQRRAADAETGGLLDLGENCAWSEIAGLDLLEQRRVGAITRPGSLGSGALDSGAHTASVYINCPYGHARSLRARERIQITLWCAVSRERIFIYMDDLRTMRLAAGLTQAELAARAGTARPNIAAYESGTKALSPELRTRLINAMRPRPSEALAGRETEVARIVAAYGATRVRVFGSTAKGDDTPESDLDLLVDFGTNTSLYTVVAMEDEISALLGVEVDLVSGRTANEEMKRTAFDLPMPEKVAG